MSEPKNIIDKHLALRGHRLPHPGASTTGPRPTHLPASQRAAGIAPDSDLPPRKRRAQRGGRRTDIAGDVINPNDGVVVEGPQGHIPEGTSRAVRQVVEMPMPKQRSSKQFTRSFVSIDGEEYVIRTRDSKGNPLPGRVAHTLYLALIEMAKGGSPLTIFDAMGLKLSDVNNKQIFPVPAHVWQRLAEQDDYEPNVVEDGQDFRLGDDDVEEDIG